MATSGNRDWAYAEAARRAKVMRKPYAIYNHSFNQTDHIVRPIEYALPWKVWKRIAIIMPDGTDIGEKYDGHTDTG